MDSEEIREALTGPVGSVKTPFLQDGDIDFAGVRNWVDFVIAGGTKSIILTVGDSLFTILSDQEIAELTKVVVQHTAGRAMVVAADRYFGTGQSVEFAKYAREVGADMLMVLPPDWAASCSPASLVEHYATVAEEIPVMVVTNIFIPRGTEFGMEVLQKLSEEVPGVVAVKDDAGTEFLRKLCIRFGERWPILSGGAKQYYLAGFPYGCVGSLSIYLDFAPHITQRFWRAIDAEDVMTAMAIIRDYEVPFCDFSAELHTDLDCLGHGAMELFGVTSRWRRKPYVSMTDEDMDRLADFFKRLSLM